MRGAVWWLTGRLNNNRLCYTRRSENNNVGKCKGLVMILKCTTHLYMYIYSVYIYIYRYILISMLSIGNCLKQRLIQTQRAISCRAQYSSSATIDLHDTPTLKVETQYEWLTGQVTFSLSRWSEILKIKNTFILTYMNDRKKCNAWNLIKPVNMTPLNDNARITSHSPGTRYKWKVCKS